MDHNDIDRLFKERLVEMSDIELAEFSWRAIIRILPVMGVKGKFIFWPSKFRAAIFYEVVYAIDQTRFAIDALEVAQCKWHAYERAKRGASSKRAKVDFLTAREAALRAARAAMNGLASSLTAHGRNHEIESKVEYALFASLHAAINSNRIAITSAMSNICYPEDLHQGDGTYESSRDAAHAMVVDTLYACGHIKLDPNSIFDLDLFSEPGKRELRIRTAIKDYAQIWAQFEKALKSLKSEYWGYVYKHIMERDFVVDSKSLVRRLGVPAEIRESGLSSVTSYLEALEAKGAVRLNEARIIILGDKGVGKTCLARRLIDTSAEMTLDFESTAGVNTMLWRLEENNINVSIWDFAGHTVTHAVHQFFMSERCLYIVVYDGRTEERNRLEYWLDHVKNYGGNSKAIVLVNARDEHFVEIPINSLKEKYDILEIYTFSIRDDIVELEAFREVVASYIASNPSWEIQTIPANFYKVKEELEALFARGYLDAGKEHITLDEFNVIAKQFEIDGVDELLKALHSLGISLWYEEMIEYNTLILNPEWISHGVYKIINWLNNEQRFSLSLADFKAVFREDKERYPVHKHEFLFKLMKHYELAYETPKTKKLIVPHLLSQDRPDSLPVYQVGESLMIRYRAEQPLPPNTISRFIVRHNEQIKKNQVWRYGVVLTDKKGTLALVREEDRMISVSVKGKNKTAYISLLRDTLNSIFESYKSDRPELLYRIERIGQVEYLADYESPLWLPDRRIINHYQKGRPYYDDITDSEIPLTKTVNVYNIQAENVLSAGAGNTVSQTTFNFSDGNMNLQGSLNELMQLLEDSGEADSSAKVGKAIQALEKVEGNNNKEEIKKKGLLNKVRRVIEDLGNKDSTIGKTVEGSKTGVEIAKDVARYYNGVAQWLGWPQVPAPLIKK